MKKLVIYTFLLFFAAGFTGVNGQIIPRFVNKRVKSAEKSSEEKLGNEVDKAIGKLFGIEEAPDSDTTQAAETPASNSTSQSPGTAIGQRAMMNAMGLSAGTANVKPEYEFDGFVEMLITEYKDDKEQEKTTYSTYIDSKSLDYGMVFSEPDDEGTSIIIFDTENSLMLTLAEEDGEKSGFAIGFTPDQAEAIAEEFEEELEEDEVDTEAHDPYKAYKTGKTKKILGYTCDEYIIDDENATITMWTTDDLDKEMKKTYMQNSSFTGMFMHAYYTNGTVMEYITEYKDNNNKTVMLVTDIDLKKRNSVSTRGYNIISMGATMPEPKENESEKEEVQESGESDAEDE